MTTNKQTNKQQSENQTEERWKRSVRNQANENMLVGEMDGKKLRAGMSEKKYIQQQTAKGKE